MQQYGTKNFACRPPSHPGDGANRSNKSFLEPGHVACQIKKESGKHEYQIFCPQITLLPNLIMGMMSIGQNSTFSEHGHVAYQIQ